MDGGTDGDPTLAPATGRLLVATPVLGDPNFDRTVVLLLEHGDEGSLGLVLNRPGELPVGDPLPRWAGLSPEPAVVFEGGPVSRSSVIGLATVTGDDARGRLPAGTWEQLDGTLGVLDLNADPDLVGAAFDRVRVYAGYAGWGPGQLVDGAWFVLPAHPDDVLGPTADGLWRRVLARHGGTFARAALVPEDPSVN